MIEDSFLTEYRVKYLEPDKIIHATKGETAYALNSVNHGSCDNSAEERRMLNNLSYDIKERNSH